MSELSLKAKKQKKKINPDNAMIPRMWLLLIVSDAFFLTLILLLKMSS
ncbi:MAG: hypothetical protein ABIJ21_02755 [Nanoarchaeota archaeon]